MPQILEARLLTLNGAKHGVSYLQGLRQNNKNKDKMIKNNFETAQNNLKVS